MIFIEPTPYILDLLEVGFLDQRDKLDIVFLTENLTQNWSVKSNFINYQILKSKKQTIYLLYSIFIKRKYSLIHVAGWSNFLTLFIIILSRIFFISVTVESDTPLNINTKTYKKIIKKFLYPILFKFPKFFLPGGRRQAEYLNYYGVKNNKIINAQMTVNVERIQKYVSKIKENHRENLRLKYNASKDDAVFLYVGRLLDWKGIRELISAIGSITDVRAKLWIVGTGELADEVINVAAKTQRISYFGRISTDLLLDIYHAADVFVLPSYWEPWGLVINEAMAAGKPIITTDTVGCVDDLLINHWNGLIIQPKNSSALSKAINFLLKNPDKLMEMADNAKAHISSWTLQNEARNMISAWKKALME